MPYKFKLTRTGGETRRLNFNSRPTWDELDSKIATLFDIPAKAVAVSYQDSDGDIVTMSTQEELYEYLTSGLKFSEPIKFTVVDKSQAVGRDGNSALENVVEVGPPTIGPTVVYEVEDSGWQRVAPIPDIITTHKNVADSRPYDTHAFVEVIDSDSEHEQEPQMSLHASAANSMGSRQQRFKGKDRDINLQADATKSDSSISIIDGEMPDRIHLRPEAQGRNKGYSPKPGTQDLMGSFGTVYAISPPADAVKVPRTFDIPPSLPAHSEVTHSLEGTPRVTAAVGVSETNTPSFARDVAKLVDDLTAAFESHPELSEGLRNIVRNAVSGSYWAADRNRASAVAESVRVVAEETSEHITRTIGTMSNNAEQEAVHMLAEALGGVFRVIGELSGPGLGERRAFGGRRFHHHHHGPRGWHGSRVGSPPPPGPLGPQGPPPPPGPELSLGNPPPPGPELSHGHLPPPPPPPGPQLGHGFPPPPPPVRPSGFEHPLPPLPPSRRPDFDHLHAPRGAFGHHPFSGGHRGMSTHHLRGPHFPGGPGSFYGPPPGPPGFNGYPFEHGHHSGRGWAGMHHPPNDWSHYDWPNFEEGQSNIHETKASLEAAKASYKAEKERFRQEKEYRRKMRQERAEQKVVEKAAASSNIPAREEQIIARLELNKRDKDKSSNRLYSNNPKASNSTFDKARAIREVPSQSHDATEVPRTTMVYSAPPSPIPAPVDYTSVPQPAPKISMSHSYPIQNDRVSLNPAKDPGPSSGPVPWPAPPAPEPSRRVQLSTLRDRILAQLFEMGFTTSSQPHLMDVLNRYTSHNDIVNEEEILSDVIAALNLGER